MNTLLSVGCSNTVGVDLEEEIGIFNKDKNPPVEALEYRLANNFSTLVANTLNLNCVNLGISGASNERIIFNAIDYIQNNTPPDLVLINLSGKSRVTFEVDSKLLDFDLTYSTEHLKYHTGIQDPNFVPFIEFYKRHSVSDYNLYKRQENLYRYIVLYLENRNIPFILSETIPTGEVLSNYTEKSISISFDEFNTKEKRNRAKGNHWLSDSHKAWSELLLAKIHELYNVWK